MFWLFFGASIVYLAFTYPWFLLFPFAALFGKIFERFQPKLQFDQFIKKGQVKKVLIIGAGSSGIAAAKEGL
jgi:hypothetical protein